jgi:hypothetical protein
MSSELKTSVLHRSALFDVKTALKLHPSATVENVGNLTSRQTEPMRLTDTADGDPFPESRTFALTIAETGKGVKEAEEARRQIREGRFQKEGQDGNWACRETGACVHPCSQLICSLATRSGVLHRDLL